MDVAPTDPIDKPASVPSHANPTYNASYNDIEGLDSSDFDPATQLALDLDTFMDTNPPREGENPTSTSMSGSFDVNDPIPCTNIAPRHNEISANFSEHNIIEGKRKCKPSSRVLGIFNTTLQSAFSANLELGKKAIHRSNLPPAPLPTPYGKQLLPLIVNVFLNSYLDADEQVYCLHPEGFARPGTIWQLDADEVVTALRTKYELCDMGNLEWFLNIRITRDRPNRHMWLTQDSYIDKIVKEFGPSDGIKVRTPLSRDSSAYKAYEGVASNEDVYYYQRRIGSLIYPAFMTRPDIAHEASLLVRFMTNPSPFHCSEADRLICYLRDTKDLSVCFSTMEASGVMINLWEGASDAAYADDKDTCSSSEGYLFKLFGGPIDWKAIRQSTITTSTTEAELLAATHAGKEIMAWRRFFKQLGFDPGQNLNLYCDNCMVTGILGKTSPVISTKLRHIDIH
ncbi:hypothetical protein VTO42DRAFT_4411 [Malbranchea cinnamomea]